MYRLSITKLRIALPILLSFVGYISFSQPQIGKHGNVVTYRGNTFEFPTPPPTDTIYITDPETGKESMKIAETIAMPLKMNGQKIYWEDSVRALQEDRPMVNSPSAFTANTIREYLLLNLTEEFKAFADGKYFFNIFNIVIDKNGKIVYAEFDGIKDHNMWREGYSDHPILVNADLQKKIIKKVDVLLDNAPASKPATVNGKHVPCLITNYQAFSAPITINNGKVVEM